MSLPGVTIILDETCAALREAVETLAPVFVFHRRAGFLATPSPAAAEELHAALVSARVPPPYVLVAASFGGFTAIGYAAHHPAMLAGMVLVDASHPAQGPVALTSIPPAESVTPSAEHFTKYLQGFGPVWTESCRSVAAIGDLGDVPLIVLAAESPDMPAEFSVETRRSLTQGWHDLQRRHAALSRSGELRIVPGAGHDLVQAASGAIVAAVSQLVRRSQRPAATQPSVKEPGPAG